MEWRHASGQATLELVANLVVPPVVRAMVFDVGETLVDETRAWSALADRVGVTRLTLFAALGALIERNVDHRLVLDLLGVDRPANDGQIEAVDFYPDALPCLRAVREGGYTVGLAGNQPARRRGCPWSAGTAGRLRRLVGPLGCREALAGVLRPCQRRGGTATQSSRCCRTGPGEAGGIVLCLRGDGGDHKPLADRTVQGSPRTSKGHTMVGIGVGASGLALSRGCVGWVLTMSR